MGRRGPRPIPTAIKIAKGTDRGNDQRKTTMGDAIDLPEPPSTLGDAGRAAWERFGSVAWSLGVLEARFLAALERLCEAHDRLAWAQADIASGGRTSKNDKGYEYARPAVTIEKEAREEIRRYLIEFGWTPASAANVRIVRDERQTSVKRRERA